MTLLLFTAPWCEACHSILPRIQELADLSGSRLEIVRIDTQEGNTLRTKYKIGILPTLIVCDADLPLQSFTGTPIPDSLEEFLTLKGLL